jgi:hypothetical protein
MATASVSSASYGVRKRMRPDLPLVTCGKCGKKIVLEYRVKKECPNKGCICYTCPGHNVSCFFVMFVYGL